MSTTTRQVEPPAGRRPPQEQGRYTRDQQHAGQHRQDARRAGRRDAAYRPQVAGESDGDDQARDEQAGNPGGTRLGRVSGCLGGGQRLAG